MPRSRNYPLSAPIVASDRQTVKALKNIADYNPHSTDHSLAALQNLDQALEQAEEELSRARLLFDTARSKVAELSWALHNSVLGAKSEVLAQFGPDSQAVYAIGLTRKSDRKRPTRRSAPAST
jgi:hypothetical protein